MYGAKLLYADTLQYHPTGAAYPEQIFGALVTEKVRSLGAKLGNVDGEVFMPADWLSSVVRAQDIKKNLVEDSYSNVH